MPGPAAALEATVPLLRGYGGSRLLRAVSVGNPSDPWLDEARVMLFVVDGTEDVASPFVEMQVVLLVEGIKIVSLVVVEVHVVVSGVGDAYSMLTSVLVVDCAGCIYSPTVDVPVVVLTVEATAVVYSDVHDVVSTAGVAYSISAAVQVVLVVDGADCTSVMLLLVLHGSSQLARTAMLSTRALVVCFMLKGFVFTLTGCVEMRRTCCKKRT